MADLVTPNNARARQIAEIIQGVDPHIILINEIDDDTGADGDFDNRCRFGKTGFLLYRVPTARPDGALTDRRSAASFDTQVSIQGGDGWVPQGVFFFAPYVLRDLTCGPRGNGHTVIREPNLRTRFPRCG